MNLSRSALLILCGIGTLTTNLAYYSSHAIANSQMLESYFQMICEVNFKDNSKENPIKSETCIKGLMIIGSKGKGITPQRLQQCKDSSNFLFCARNSLNTKPSIADWHEHGREVKAISGRPHNLDTSKIRNLEATIKGVTKQRIILWSNGSKALGCKGSNIYGYYMPINRSIVMCQGNHNNDYAEIIDTLKHEGWHAVQHLCRNNVRFLSIEEINSRISQSDANNLHGYHPSKYVLEAEARVIAKLPYPQWKQLVNKECK